ncbi:hypothetical protein P3T25_005512 [Paraburkholderia sp. GAS32]|jgi:hypothetical protein
MRETATENRRHCRYRATKLTLTKISAGVPDLTARPFMFNRHPWMLRRCQTVRVTGRIFFCGSRLRRSCPRRRHVPPDAIADGSVRNAVRRHDAPPVLYAMDWACPACGRSEPQIAQLNANGSLMCRLVEHHDHMKDPVKTEFERECKSRKVLLADGIGERFAERASQMVSAYANAIICDDCNAADRNFSFSPQESGSS